MPIYPYRCPQCEGYAEIVKRMSDSGDAEDCALCHIPMERQYTAPQVSIPTTGYYDYGLGQRIGNKGDKRDALRRIKDTTGRELVEVGNEKLEANRKSEKYTVTRDQVEQVRAEITRGEHKKDGLSDN